MNRKADVSEADGASPSGHESEGDEPKRDGATRRVIVAIVVVLPVLCALLYYWPILANWVLLERWSEAGPRATVGNVCEALVSNDTDALTEALGERPDLSLTIESGVIVGVKLGGGPAPPVGVWPLRTPGASVRSLEYNLPGGSVAARVRAETGPELVFGLRKVHGQWRVERIMGPPPPAAAPGDGGAEPTD
jgi:hypothetical protein